ncbi:MAG: tRNA uridine-5-carboxymethylaminomethyl(34) synthesis GTPase MnmE, partial [Candidatus Edwardsbacteria bacterium]|nr:tRNA uridine-5-carboxymethylaminomethyl(34) synthesis GTPase MnmE [Candidatus Edwardsbacteria bacterium]
MELNDTIVAVATAPGPAALAVVRISGGRAVGIADKIFQGKTPPSRMPTHTLQHGRIHSQRGQVIDEAVLGVMLAPRSFTGEDTVEITCHGGNVAAPAVVEIAILAGARQARPGEFTLRAFLNDKMDLSQAEAVCDVISASTQAAAKAALERLAGGLSKKIRDIRGGLLDVLAQLEAMIDFPEDDLPQPVFKEILGTIGEAQERINALLDASRTAQVLKDGARVVIAGRPNTGKSSLFNLLLREERAIVTEHPGTTRDVLEGWIEIRGIPVRLFDTAGLRETTDQIEVKGVDRARGKVAQADLILLVIDASRPPRYEDKALLDQTKELPRLVVLNKSDLKPAFAAQAGWIKLSALTGQGLPGLEQAAVAALTGGRGVDAAAASAAN